MPLPFKGTFSRFSRRGIQAKSLPAEPKPEPTPERTEPSQTVKKEETDQQETDKLDETIVPKEIPTRQKLVKKTAKAEEGQELTGRQTVAHDTSDSIFQMLWRAEAAYHMTPVRYTKTNVFYPNAIPLFQLLEAAEKRINLSKHIQTHEVIYLPYAVKVYYAIMYYIQILEAKNAAGTLEGDEASLLNRFSRKYPRNSLPCAQIVYSYFNAIVATELADEKYDWITPDFATSMFHGSVSPTVNGFDTAQISASGAEYLQPHIPMMMGMLNTFIHYDPSELSNRMRRRTFTPVDINTATNATAFGQTFRNNSGARNDFKPMFQACGISSRFSFGNENYSEAQDYALNSDFGASLKFVVSDTNTPDLNNATTDWAYPDLEHFIFMNKRNQGNSRTSNLKWFDYLRTQAIIHARFFDQTYHFSDIQTTGGLESSVQCKLKLEGDSPPQCFYHDLRLGMTQAADWYRHPFDNIVGGFATNRAGVRRNEELQAFTFGINATLPIIIRATSATPITGLLPIPSLSADDATTGEIWKNTQWIKQLNWKATNVEGKPMYSDYPSVVLGCYRDTPHGTGALDNEL